MKKKSKIKQEINVCSMCERKAYNHRFEYRVLYKNNKYCDFCSTRCLLKYFGKVLKYEVRMKLMGK